MTEKSVQNLRRIYGICLSILSVVVAALFIVQILAIFRSEEGYTVELISKKFSQIAIPFWLWLVSIVGGGVITYKFPEEEEKPKAFVDMKITLKRLQSRIPQDVEGLREVNETANKRKMFWLVSVGVCVVSTVVSLVYLLNMGYTAKFDTEFFQSHVEAEKLIMIAPWVLVALGVCAGALIYQGYCLKKELAKVKIVFADCAKAKMLIKPQEEKKKREMSPKLVMAVRAGLAVVGVVLFIVGIFNGGMADVLTKAINICTQCIGLG